MPKTPNQARYYRWLVLGCLLYGVILWQALNFGIPTSPSPDAHILNTIASLSSPTDVVRPPPVLLNGTKNGTWPVISARFQRTEATATPVTSSIIYHQFIRQRDPSIRISRLLTISERNSHQ